MMMRSSRIRWWVVTLTAGLTVCATAWLGLWQLSRADTKLAWADQLSMRQAMAPLSWQDLNQVLSKDPAALQQVDAWEPLWHRSIELQGTWLHHATTYLDNRPMSGRVGYFVVTPLLDAASGVSVLVQRGWVPRHMQDRTLVPPVPLTTERVTVLGRFAPAPSKLFELGPEPGALIRQNIDLSEAASEWSLDLLHASVIQLTPELPNDGLLQEWPVIGADVHKHYGYAVQWFSLSSLTLLLYVWFQLIAPRRRSKTLVTPP